MSSGDGSESRGSAVNESYKDVLGKNRQGRAVQSVLLKYLAILSWNRESSSGWVNVMQLCLSHSICATNSRGRKAACLE